MTVISSLFSGISGIVSNGSALSVAGDNIANMSTPAFKSSVPVFESALSQRIGEAEVGLGSRLAGTTANFSQGAFANTTRATDLAIEGKGFFIVESESGERFYTRAGLFEQNANFQLVTSAGGFVLQGYNVDDNNQVLTPIDLSTVKNSPPEQTSSMAFAMNLDADAEIPSTNTWDTWEHAAESSNYSYSQTIYDSLGRAQTVTTYFRYQGLDTSGKRVWDYRTMTAASALSSAPSGLGDNPIAVQYGSLTFNTDGSLYANTTPDLDATPMTTFSSPSSFNALIGNTAVLADSGTHLFPSSTVAAGLYVTQTAAYGVRWAGATPPVGTAFASTDIFTIANSFGSVNTNGATATATTQYNAAESSIISATQNGRGKGDLQSIEVEDDGTIRGNFSNGSTRDLFIIPLAVFANDNGLARVGSNLYSESGSSGSPQTGSANSEGRGKVRSFVTEQSNVDLASEFVKIITFQRAFQASSRTVSTAAELLQDLVNLGR